MVRNIHAGLIRLYTRIQKRNSKLSEDARKKGAAVILLLFSILLGLWAYGTANTEVRISWLKEHTPSDAFWSKTLKERGYLPVIDSRWWEKSANEFPFRKPSSPNVWITENRRLFIRYATNGWEAWGLEDTSPPVPDRNLWESLGYGWDALDTFVQLNLPITRTNALPKIRAQSWRDPRAIHY